MTSRLQSHPIYRSAPQQGFNFGEIIVDNFAGGGGASTGIEAALGRQVDVAINHDPIAIECHTVNHPNARHYCESVWDVDPRTVYPGHQIGLAWFSPDCRHFSKAKGAAPVSPRVRGLAWIALRWIALRKPKLMVLENVEEFQTWGPVLRDEHGNYYPCPARKGRTFRSFINALRRHGYAVDYRELRACDYGAPTSRKRLFLIARRDGLPIIWPEPTHGPGQIPYRTAADCIDWSLPCPSIFERKRPLAEATCRRIAAGIMRYVVNNPEPFIVKVNHAYDQFRGQRIGEPMQTVTATNGWGLVFSKLAPVVERQFGNSAGNAADIPLGAITAGGGGKSALITAFLAKHYGGVVGHGVKQPLGTVTTVDHHSLVTSHLVKLRGTCRDGQRVDEPLHTISAGGQHHGEVRAFLIKYYGNEAGGVDIKEPMDTIPTHDRFGLVTVHGEPYQIVDIGMRMLGPHELARAQGFPADYRLRDLHGRPLSKKDQVRLIGNSVCPPVAEAIVRANMVDIERRAAA